MAKRNYRARARAWGSRRWANRGAYYSKAKSFYGKTGLQITPEFAAGFGAAFVLPDNAMLDAGSIVVATAPVRGLGKAKGAAQGYLLGQLTQQFILPKLGINFGNVMGGNQPRFANYI